MLHLPATGKLQLLVGEHVEEGDKVTIVLVALKVMGVPSHLADHVLQAGVARKHAVGTLGTQQRATWMRVTFFNNRLYLLIFTRQMLQENVQNVRLTNEATISWDCVCVCAQMCVRGGSPVSD